MPTKSFLVAAAFLALLLIPAARSPAAVISLVNHTNVWSYRKGTASAPQSNWKTVVDASLDATWLSGPGGIGYADNLNETNQVKTVLSDMHNSYTTVAMRRTFEVTSNIDSALHLILKMDWDDGFIAWLDGAYLTSALSPGAPAEPAYNAVATGLHESSRGSSGEPPVSYDLGAIGSRLAIGTHVLAIVGLNEAASSSDFIQIADLVAGASSAIAVDTTWRLADSPITPSGDVVVNAGVTLTIEPGVRVLLDPGLNIIANGRLLAEGDATHRIVFTRSPNNPDRWGNIQIPGGVGSPESRIRYADIQFNGATAISVQGGTAWLDNLTFGSTDHTYIEVDGASFVISDCVFPSGSVKFELVHGTSGVRNDGHGIMRHNFFGRTVGYADVVDFTGGNRPGPIVHFINNVFSGSQDDGIDVDGTDAWIEGNIFVHVHRNGDTPDSSSAVSGGDNSGQTSEVTIINNLFFDCDNAATAKQGNFFTLINNTIVHMTKTGGIDGGSGVVVSRDTTPSVTTFGKGFYLEGNVIVDVEQLARNYDATQTSVTFVNNILPLAWTGPGSGNTVTNPLLKHIPTVSEATFSTWAQAQIMRDWFSLLPGSPAIGTGPNGTDKGGLVPFGASISGVPDGYTTQTNIGLRVGVNRTGSGIPTTGWPNGAGYTAFKFRLDGGSWSTERALSSGIALRGLPNGPHYVEVVGKRDSGLYQDDPLFGEDVTITRSRTWTVEHFKLASETFSGTDFTFGFTAESNQTYTVLYRDAFDPAHPWTPLTNITAQPDATPITITDPDALGRPSRFYRISLP